MKIPSLIAALTVVAALSASAGDHSGKNIAPVLDSKVPITDAKAPIEKQHCLSYDYIDLDYGWFDSPGVGFDDGDAYGLSFSKTLGEIFFLTGGYTNGSSGYLFNNDFYDFESHRYTLGFGARFGLAECVDLTIEGGATHGDNRFGNNPEFNNDSWAYYVGPGLRARVGKLEGFAKVFYVERDGGPAQYALDDDGWVFNPGLLYHLNESLALKVSANLTEENALLTVGARINF